MTEPSPRVLAIGRSDALGLEGLQGDQRTVEALGGRAASVVVNLCSADTGAPHDEVELPATFIVRQFETVMARHRIAAIKLGRLSSEEQVETVARLLESLPSRPPVILAPALFRLTGERVLGVRALAHWKRRLPHLATVMVASGQEAAALGGFEIGDRADLRHATELLATLGSDNVLLTGTLAAEGRGLDLLLGPSGKLVEREFPLPESLAGRVGTVLGEGGLGRSILAAGIATELARGRDLQSACELARNYVVTELTRQRNDPG